MIPENKSNLPDWAAQLSSLVKNQDGMIYRDLNKNGRLDLYEDPRQPVKVRVEDLLSQMTLEEKAGCMFINGSIILENGSLDADPNDGPHQLVAKDQMDRHRMNHFNLWAAPPVKTIAAWHNRLQRYAEKTRLGIPVSIASDPRNHFSNNIYDFAAAEFSQWCNCLGFGALDDISLMKHFADAVRKEYLAAGIRIALHPQIDLATEPRWPRISGTFGEDAHISARMGKAYIEGFQGESLGPHSVACMPKHFPGGGPQQEGLDPHFEFQKGQIYPGNNFDYHLIPFEAAFEAQPAALMPYYGVPMDQTGENVGMSYNKEIITGLAREKYGYQGIICTDWGLVTDTPLAETIWPARAWGAEHLTPVERCQKILEAGVDQFGGESCPELVVELVRQRKISEERIDQSVRRLLHLKFQLGLFDNPFVDESQLPEIFGDPSVRIASLASQQHAMTLLKNKENLLPLQNRPRIFLKNINADIAAQYGEVVPTPQQADFAILHLETPWYPVESKNPFARGFHHGDLDFKGEVLAEILDALNVVPSIVVIHLDRPAVIPEINAAAAGLLGEFGASDRAILDVIFGRDEPQGRLPFELPSSMDAVRKQRTDMPHDSENPLYPFGFGLHY